MDICYGILLHMNCTAKKEKENKKLISEITALWFSPEVSSAQQNVPNVSF